MTTASQNEPFDPFKTSSKYRACHENDFQNHLKSSHACQRFSNVQKAPGQVWMKKCPMFRTCHAKRRSRLQKCPGSPTPATKNERSSIKEHRAPVKVDLRKPAKRDPHFARACAVEMHMGISQSASRRRQKPGLTEHTLI